MPARGRSTRTTRVRTIALIVAAGRGERAGGGLPKQYRPLGGVSVLRRSVAAFAGHPGVESVRVVIADGHQDLYLVNGYVSASRSDSYWYDYSKVAGGHEIVIADAKNWPAMGERSLAGYQPKRVWMNDGAGRFVDVAQMVGVTDRFDGRSVATADFENRGMIDVVVANQRGPLLYYRNDVAPGRGYVAFDLEGGCRPDTPTGTRCTNRNAIGKCVSKTVT